VDAVLAEAEALVDESLLTGESIAIAKTAGQTLLGGSINMGHPIKVVASGPVARSMLASIVALLERTQAQRAAIARGADRVAAWFVVLTLTLATAAAFFWLYFAPARALPAALAVLVVTCPCALSLATPAAIAAATARLARLGLLVTRADALQRLCQVDVVVVDKTGTLTQGTPTVAVGELQSGRTQAEVLAIAAALESRSDHPIAAAFLPHAARGVVGESSREFAGRGVEGVVGGRLWRLGSREFVAELEGSSASGAAPKADLFLGNSSGSVATFEVRDTLRPDALDAVEQLRELELEVAIASGDREEVVRTVARQLGIQTALGCLTPERKLAIVKERQRGGARVLMVGDGINDGPVLAVAAVSCALAQGSAVAQAAADLLLMNTSLVTVAEAIRTARRLRGVIRQNLGWALAYNLAAVPLAAMGWIAPWVAAVGMSTSSLLVVLNAARLARRP
jgi:Cu2+-exporting ATPase